MMESPAESFQSSVKQNVIELFAILMEECNYSDS